MPQWIVDLVGESLAPIVWVAIVAILVCLLAMVVIFLARKLMGGTMGVATRSRAPRLAVMDVARIDEKRRLILIRRDEVEHLVLVGGQNDVVVEGNILRLPASASADEPFLDDLADERPNYRRQGETTLADRSGRQAASAPATARTASASSSNAERPHSPIVAPAPQAAPQTAPERSPSADRVELAGPKAPVRPVSTPAPAPAPLPVVEPQRREAAARSAPSPVPSQASAPAATAAVAGPSRSSTASARIDGGPEPLKAAVARREMQSADTAPGAPPMVPVEAAEMSIPRANLRRMINEIPGSQAPQHGTGGEQDSSEPKPRPLSVTSFATAIQNRKASVEAPPPPSPAKAVTPPVAAPPVRNEPQTKTTAIPAAVAWPTADHAPKASSASSPPVSAATAPSSRPVPAPADAAERSEPARSPELPKHETPRNVDNDPSLEDFLSAELDSGFDDDVEWPSWEQPGSNGDNAETSNQPSGPAAFSSVDEETSRGLRSDDRGETRDREPAREVRTREDDAPRATVPWPVAEAPSRSAQAPAAGGQKSATSPSIDAPNRTVSPAIDPVDENRQAAASQKPRQLTMEEEMERLLGDFGFDGTSEEKRR